jgi:6-pyruvoyl-tetrahydropterin synthase
MRGAWPKVTASIRFHFDACHSMTRIGGESAEVHEHRYEVIFGWTHEIQPRFGYTHERSEQVEKFEGLIGDLHTANLNEVLPMQPSAEVIALWLLAQTEPAYCDHVIVRTYDGYEARADRDGQRSEWMQFLAGRATDPYSSAEFTLK